MFKIDFEKKYKVQQYEFKYFDQWNAFKPKNAPFFFIVILEYQEDRFQDYSLLILRKIS
jgi:hypothetical protein